MNTKELAQMLINLNGATICNLTYITDAKLLKRGNPLKDCKVDKIESLVCQFGYNYQNSVNNRLEKQGDEREFVADSLPWGKWIVVNKIIEHNGELYARFYVMQGGKREVLYLVNNEIATSAQVEVIKQFTPARKESNRQAESGLTENQCKPFTINLKNVISLKVNGEEYRLKTVAMPVLVE